MYPKHNFHKPPWLRKKINLSNTNANKIKILIVEKNLETVCHRARCPNLGECYSKGTATFLLMGPSCTRNCKFCSISNNDIAPFNMSTLNELEPEKILESCLIMELSYIVITSVSRDDLPDRGANHFIKVVSLLKSKIPDIKVEVLVPDFGYNRPLFLSVAQAGADVFNFNMETVAPLYPVVRDVRFNYNRSLELLKDVKNTFPEIVTKSGIMLGLGEKENEIINVIEDLVVADCDILTIGQYIPPTKSHYPVFRYVSPMEFRSWVIKAEELGIKKVLAGPYIRSSYMAFDTYKLFNPNYSGLY